MSKKVNWKKIWESGAVEKLGKDSTSLVELCNKLSKKFKMRITVDSFVSARRRWGHTASAEKILKKKPKKETNKKESKRERVAKAKAKFKPKKEKDVTKKAYKRLLIMSDSHNPYHHQDSMAFYKAIKKKYKPDGVVHVGDEVDKHAMSFHDSDPDLPSAGDELEQAIESLKPLYKIFPEVLLVDSNHGSMVYRKGKHHGIPRKYLRDYGEILEAPKGWTWHNKLQIRLSDGRSVFICHGAKKNGIQLAQQLGCHTIQGHFHTDFNIQYASSPSQLLWSMQVGCTIDDDSMAFHYNKAQATRPIIGCGIVIDGLPKLLPMILDNNGRWIGVVP